MNLKQTFVVFTARSGGTDDAGQAYVFGNVPLGFDFQRDLDAAYENYANVLNSKKWGYDISVGGDGLLAISPGSKVYEFSFQNTVLSFPDEAAMLKDPTYLSAVSDGSLVSEFYFGTSVNVPNDNIPELEIQNVMRLNWQTPGETKRGVGRNGASITLMSSELNFFERGNTQIHEIGHKWGLEHGGSGQYFMPRTKNDIQVPGQGTYRPKGTMAWAFSSRYNCVPEYSWEISEALKSKKAAYVK